MQEEVVLEIGLLGEATMADVTLEGPVPVVDVGVCLQISRGGE